MIFSEYFMKESYIMLLYFNDFFFFKQKTAYEMRISDWSSDVCSSDLNSVQRFGQQVRVVEGVVQTPTFLAFHGRADHQFSHLCQIAQLNQVAADLVVAVELIDFIQQQPHPDRKSVV